MQNSGILNQTLQASKDTSLAKMSASVFICFERFKAKRTDFKIFNNRSNSVCDQTFSRIPQFLRTILNSQKTWKQLFGGKHITKFTFFMSC